jgi:hypothetical protein
MLHGVHLDSDIAYEDISTIGEQWTDYLPAIELIDAAPSTHASQFQYPAKKPTTRPYFFPGVTEAQWYTPPAEGMAEASSAIDAAIIQ